MESIVREARALLRSGCRELNVVAVITRDADKNFIITPIEPEPEPEEVA